jgi:hypothetical protein
MTHPGLMSPLIAQAAAALGEVVLSDADRGRATAALDEMKQPWVDRHRTSYQAAVERRDEQHDGVIDEADQFVDMIERLVLDLDKGRIRATDKIGYDPEASGGCPTPTASPLGATSGTPVPRSISFASGTTHCRLWTTG